MITVLVPVTSVKRSRTSASEAAMNDLFVERRRTQPAVSLAS